MSWFGANRRKKEITIGWILSMLGSWKLDVGITISCPEDKFKVYK